MDATMGHVDTFAGPGLPHAAAWVTVQFSDVDGAPVDEPGGAAAAEVTYFDGNGIVIARDYADLGHPHDAEETRDEVSSVDGSQR